MSKEWINQFNSFNSLKVLCWREKFEEIMDGKIPNPVSMTVDGTNLCNLNCSFCQYSKYRNDKPDTVSREDLFFTIEVAKKLGIFSICYSGGGEPLMHSSCGKYMRVVKDAGIQIGIITNGILIDKYLDDIIHSLRWIGVSIDSSTSQTYQKMKGGTKEQFEKVINNITKLAKNRDNTPSIGFKFLIHPDNYHEIYAAAELAKGIGADDFHLRPCYNADLKWPSGSIKLSLSQIEDAREDFEDEKFHVYGVTHKFDDAFRKKKMEKCEVTPIAGLTFAADGYCYVCCDNRGTEQGRLCEWHDILEVWGSKKHKDVLKNLDPKKCPYRCTYSPHQEILDNVFREDKMTMMFP